jgi:DNA-binding transcriptional regulator YiaG
MNTFSNAFRAEVVRMARKELKPELQGMRQAITSHRSEIAALKRELKAVTSQLKTTQRQLKVTDTPKVETPKISSKQPPFEFNAELLEKMRAALGITRTDFATLLGASALSVSKWTSGGVQPRAAQLAKIETVLRMGPKKALKTLQKLKEA